MSRKEMLLDPSALLFWMFWYNYWHLVGHFQFYSYFSFSCLEKGNRKLLLYENVLSNKIKRNIWSWVEDGIKIMYAYTLGSHRPRAPTDIESCFWPLNIVVKIPLEFQKFGSCKSPMGRYTILKIFIWGMPKSISSGN